VSAVAFTWNVCDASDKPVYEAGLAHALNGPPSSAHSYPVTDSFALNEKLGSAVFDGLLGFDEIVIVGGVVSSVKLRTADQSE
jgi:hypothetical protein